jgi:E3 ubiquitin-protein ligase HERC2
MSGQLDIVVHTQSRLDGKWLKTDLQQALSTDGLAQLWNEMVKDGELTGSFSDGLLNSVGITAHKGNFVFYVILIKTRYHSINLTSDIQ